MKDKILEDISESDVEWNENDIINDDILAMSNLTNMVSLSSIYMPNSPGSAINSTDVLSYVDEDNKHSKK
jgi:hypothetical protein